MGFISFNENYYLEKLKKFESRELTNQDIYEVKQLLKVLDDLTDEGYTNLNERMEIDFSCLTRLHSLLDMVKEEPFSIYHKNHQALSYSSSKFELSDSLEMLIKEAKDSNQISCNAFLQDIYEYSKWIEYNKDSAYVFLLRDTLLPYVYFKSRYEKGIYPWLISRRFIEDITGVENADDDIRLPLYEALENGHISFEDYFSHCRKGIISALNEYPKLKRILKDLLGSIKEERIVIVESGYMGTIPLMLKALDDRVTFKLYTTAPFLYDTYDDFIFCRKYEDIRKFETVYSQDMLMRYDSYSGGKFYVNVSEDSDIKRKALVEIIKFMK